MRGSFLLSAIVGAVQRVSLIDVAWTLAFTVALFGVSRKLGTLFARSMAEEVRFAVSPFPLGKQLAPPSESNGPSVLLFSPAQRRRLTCHQLLAGAGQTADSAKLERFSGGMRATGLRCTLVSVADTIRIESEVFEIDSATNAAVISRGATIAVVDSDGRALLSFSQDTAGSRILVGDLLRERLRARE